MPRGRGGARQGTPGKAYSNRTDLMLDRAPQQGTVTAAAGGQTAPAQPAQPFVTPDMIPRLDDPSTRPQEPVTAGLASGLGPGPEALGGMVAPQDPNLATLQAAYLRNPTPELRAVIMRLSAQGLL